MFKILQTLLNETLYSQYNGYHYLYKKVEKNDYLANLQKTGKINQKQKTTTT